MWRWICFLVVLVGLEPTVLSGQERAPMPEAVSGDQQELQEIFRENELHTAPEKPGIALYIKDFTYAVLGVFLDRLGAGLMGLVAAVAQVQILFVLALGLLVAILARLLYSHYQRRKELALEPAPVTASRPPGSDEDNDVGDEGWAEELRRRLAAGDVALACEALWWWLARTLMPSAVESSWTSRELLTRAGRTDLRASAARLDRMIYGAESPTVEDVQALWLDLEASAGQQAAGSADG